MTAVVPLRQPSPAAPGPPESRGIPRDGVKLMVATRRSVRHTTFSHLPDQVEDGDLLVINVSATVPGSLDGSTADGEPIRLHLSSPQGGRIWTVEPRHPVGIGSERYLDFDGGTVALPGGAQALLHTRDARSPRLWLAELVGVDDIAAYLDRHGQPIRYSHTAGAWPLSDYQSAYARVPGSAEMPSAGRPFTPELIARLVAEGVYFAPVVLHAGVASFEDGERPDVERYEVPESSAALVNHVRATGGRVIGVGTTAVRALETVTDSRGVVHPGSGVTDLVLGRDRGVRVIGGLVTGWHDVGASHLDLVAAVGGARLVERCYEEADALGYLRHEFGDSLLLMGS